MPRIRNICKECGGYKAHSSSPRCIPCRYCDPKGYGEFSLFGSEKKAHRVAWLLFNGPIPEGLHVLHRCDNPPCVNPDHLFIGTHQDNMADMLRKGRARLNGRNALHCRGERHFNARLKTADVILIKTSIDPTKSLAARFGITKEHVNKIKRGEKWAHVQPGVAV